MASPKLALYHGVPTRSTRVVIVLEELGLAYDVIPIDIRKGEAAQTPSGTIPYLKDGDLGLSESGAIVQYLISKYGAGRLSVAVDSPAYCQYLQYFWWAEATLNQSVMLYLHHSMIRPEEKRLPTMASESAADIAKGLAELEVQLTKTGAFLAGPDFTGADVMMAGALHMVVDLAQLLDRSKTPAVAAYYDALKARPSFKKAYGL